MVKPTVTLPEKTNENGNDIRRFRRGEINCLKLTWRLATEGLPTCTSHGPENFHNLSSKDGLDRAKLDFMKMADDVIEFTPIPCFDVAPSAQQLLDHWVVAIENQRQTMENPQSTDYALEFVQHASKGQAMLLWKQDTNAAAPAQEKSNIQRYFAAPDKHGNYTVVISEIELMLGKGKALLAITDIIDDITPPVYSKEPSSEQLAIDWLTLVNEHNCRKTLRFNAEMDVWIIAHGSDHLKAVSKAGKHCKGLYIRERAAQDFPFFMVDSNNEYQNYPSRGNPSEQGFALEQEAQQTAQALDDHLKVSLKWMRESPPTEIVVVENYLGKYTLVQRVDCLTDLVRVMEAVSDFRQIGFDLADALTTIAAEETNVRLAQTLAATVKRFQDNLQHTNSINHTIATWREAFQHYTLYPTSLVDTLTYNKNNTVILDPQVWVKMMKQRIN